MAVKSGEAYPRGAKSFAVVAAVVLLGGCAARAQRAGSDWAFPQARPVPQETQNPATIMRLPGSAVQYTRAGLAGGFTAIDWRPERRLPLPSVVRFGRPPAVMACGYCHLPDGNGRPENAALAGLPAAYISRQMHAFRSGERKGARPEWPPIAAMLRTAHAVPAVDITKAAEYFSNRTYVERTHVVETADIPAVVPEAFVYRRLAGADREKLGVRIIETPDDFSRFELRDGTLGITAYVPPGAVARGQSLAVTGNQGQIRACLICHGSGLRGSTIAPPLAGRSPTYLFRQLDAFRSGSRQVEAMQTEVSHLSTSDLVDLAAYTASLKP